MRIKAGVDAGISRQQVLDIASSSDAYVVFVLE